jgi:hypothetical protein
MHGTALPLKEDGMGGHASCMGDMREEHTKLWSEYIGTKSFLRM